MTGLGWVLIHGNNSKNPLPPAGEAAPCLSRQAGGRGCVFEGRRWEVQKEGTTPHGVVAMSLDGRRESFNFFTHGRRS